MTTEGTQNQAAANPETGNQGAGENGHPETSTAGAENAAGTDPFAELDADTREWLGKREIKDAKAAAKLAHEQAKMLGNAVRVPGKDAKPEEVEAFLDKLGRPAKADEYKFEMPKLPEAVPYDSERANGFKSLAHKLGLTQAQAAALHDWAAENALTDFNSGAERAKAQTVAQGEAEKSKLEKLWGPLDGQTARENLVMADRAIREFGGDELVAEFERVGLLGRVDDKGTVVVLSAPLAATYARIGASYFKEDGIVRGDPSLASGNPFDPATGNETIAGRLVRDNPERAKTLIRAAGLKIEDFGLKA